MPHPPGSELALQIPEGQVDEAYKAGEAQGTLGTSALGWSKTEQHPRGGGFGAPYCVFWGGGGLAQGLGGWLC